MTHAQPTQKRIIYVRGLNWLSSWRLVIMTVIVDIFFLLIFLTRKSYIRYLVNIRLHMIWLYLTQKILQPTLDPLRNLSKNIQTLQAPTVRSIEVNRLIIPILTQIFMT